MLFSEFTNYLEKLEETSKRLEITSILEELITNLKNNEVDKALYLALGQLGPKYKSENFNIAEKMLISSVEIATEKTRDKIMGVFSKVGDLGTTYEQLSNQTTLKNSETKTKTAKRKQRTNETPIKTKHTRQLIDGTSLEISSVFEKLSEIAKLSGEGSQDKKISETSSLLKKMENKEAKYIIRMILGTTRLGFTATTVTDALVSNLLKKDPALNKKEIKATLTYKHNIFPDIGRIAYLIKTKGLKGIEQIDISVGIPVIPQKAQRLPSPTDIIEKMQRVWCEYKFDGTRVQLHMDRSKKIVSTELEQKSLFSTSENKERTFIKTFTTNLDETTHQFPDIVDAAEKQINATSIIIDGEAVGYDKKTKEFLPFQMIMQRKRKHDIKKIAQRIPLYYFAFDLLFLDGESYTDKPLKERKKHA